MAWVKQRYKTKAGWRYAVGYADEVGIERTHGGFTSATEANSWADKLDGAAAQGRDELKAFLDRTLRKSLVQPEVLTLEKAFSLWWIRDADPKRSNGLARSTARNYLDTWNRHVQPRVGGEPLADFARPGPCASLFRQLRDAGVGEPTVKLVRAVLSSMLSWAVEAEYVADNGVRRVQRRSRRSNRAGSRQQARWGAPSAAALTPRAERQGRALSPRAVAAIYRAQLADPAAQHQTRPLRDGTATLTQYLLGCRNQELWGLRWEDVGDRTTSFVEVVSFGALDAGKTWGSRRSIPTPALLIEVLEAWRNALTRAGHPPEPTDFIFAGSAEPGHMTANEARQWPRRYFVTVCKGLAGALDTTQAEQRRFKDTDRSLSYLLHSTQYSLRRGHMSVRLRAGEDSAVIARTCGTSVQMLHRHYADDIAEAGSDVRSLEEQLREALGRGSSAEPPRHLQAVV